MNSDVFAWSQDPTQSGLRDERLWTQQLKSYLRISFFASACLKPIVHARKGCKMISSKFTSYLKERD